MVPPIACQWRQVIALRVYLETWWCLWVFWVLFGTYPYDLMVYICQNCLLNTTIFFLFCAITIKKQDFSIMILKCLRKCLNTITILNTIMSKILVPTPCWKWSPLQLPRKVQKMQILPSQRPWQLLTDKVNIAD